MAEDRFWLISTNNGELSIHERTAEMSRLLVIVILVPWTPFIPRHLIILRCKIKTLCVHCLAQTETFETIRECDLNETGMRIVYIPLFDPIKISQKLFDFTT